MRVFRLPPSGPSGSGSEIRSPLMTPSDVIDGFQLRQVPFLRSLCSRIFEIVSWRVRPGRAALEDRCSIKCLRKTSDLRFSSPSPLRRVGVESDSAVRHDQGPVVVDVRRSCWGVRSRFGCFHDRRKAWSWLGQGTGEWSCAGWVDAHAAGEKLVMPEASVGPLATGMFWGRSWAPAGSR